MNEFLEHLHIDRAVVLNFFMSFARFEYCLKKTGYLRADVPYAAPDWNRFADSVDIAVLRASRPVAESIDYLFQHPPKRQVRRENSVDWQDQAQRPGESDIRWLLRCVKTVRNNLFHGGKYAYEYVHEPARNTELLRSCMDILNEIRNQRDSIREVWNE